MVAITVLSPSVISSFAEDGSDDDDDDAVDGVVIVFPSPFITIEDNGSEDDDEDEEDDVIDTDVVVAVGEGGFADFAVLEEDIVEALRFSLFH